MLICARLFLFFFLFLHLSSANVRAHATIFIIIVHSRKQICAQISSRRTFKSRNTFANYNQRRRRRRRRSNLRVSALTETFRVSNSPPSSLPFPLKNSRQLSRALRLIDSIFV